VIEDEMAVADAHPFGARPFAREQYIAKFRTLADGLVSKEEQDRFLAAAENVENLSDLRELNVRLTDEALAQAPQTPEGIFSMAGLFGSTKSNAQKRAEFRASLENSELTKLPGAFNPLTARLIQDIGGFEGVYISGAVLANDLGLPDIGLTTLTEVAQRAGQIARVTDLPVLVDADTGFGEPMSAARTIATLEDAGLAGCHLEDQV